MSNTMSTLISSLGSRVQSGWVTRKGSWVRMLKVTASLEMFFTRSVSTSLLGGSTSLSLNE